MHEPLLEIEGGERRIPVGGPAIVEVVKVGPDARDRGARGRRTWCRDP